MATLVKAPLLEEMRTVLRPLLLPFTQIDAACIDQAPETQTFAALVKVRKPVILLVFVRQPNTVGRRQTLPLAAELREHFGWPFVVHVVVHRGDPKPLIGDRPVVFVRGRAGHAKE